MDKIIEPNSNANGQNRIPTVFGFIIIVVIVATIVLLVWKYMNF